MFGRFCRAQLVVFYVCWKALGGKISSILRVWKALGGSMCRILRAGRALGGSMRCISHVLEGSGKQNHCFLRVRKGLAGYMCRILYAARWPADPVKSRPWFILRRFLEVKCVVFYVCWKALGGKINRILSVWKAPGGSKCRILRVWKLKTSINTSHLLDFKPQEVPTLTMLKGRVGPLLKNLRS